MLTDTEAVIKHLIKQVKEGIIADPQYTSVKTYMMVEIPLHGGWAATLVVDDDNVIASPGGSIAIEKEGSDRIIGFFSQHRKPSVYEHARDLCARIREGYSPQTQEVIGEAMPDLEL